MITRLLALLVAAAILGGCGLPGRPSVIDAARAEAALEAALEVDLVAVPKVPGIAMMTDVVATYSAETANEHVLMIVFSSSDATLQVRGRDYRPPADVAASPLVAANVVVFYSVEPGTVNRRDSVRRALEKAAQAA